MDSQEKSLAKGRDEIQHLVLQLEITPHGDTVEGAHRLYRIALQRNFTRGRRTAQVYEPSHRMNPHEQLISLFALLHAEMLECSITCEVDTSILVFGFKRREFV